MYYFTFLTTYSISSAICAGIDYFFPSLRVDKVSKESIIKDYKKMLPIVCSNLLLAYPIFKYTGDYIDRLNIQDQNFYEYMLIWLLITDFTFYGIHRAFHQSYLFKKIHYIHHRFFYTYGMGAIYAHPLDFLLANLFPTFLTVWIIPPTRDTAIFIIVFSSTFTVFVSHGCYKIFDDSHLKHHLRFKKNYGLFISDRIFNTYI